MRAKWSVFIASSPIFFRPLTYRTPPEMNIYIGLHQINKVDPEIAKISTNKTNYRLCTLSNTSNKNINLLQLFVFKVFIRLVCIKQLALVNEARAKKVYQSDLSIKLTFLIQDAI